MSSRVPALATPALIEWARLKSGLSREQVARHFQVTPDRVAQWESGAQKPTVNQLRRFGRLVRRPLAFFYLSEPPRDFDAIRDFRRIPEFEPEPESPELLLAIRTAHDRRSIALDLMEDLEENPETQLPTLTLDGEPESMASMIRVYFGFDSGSAAQFPSFYEALNFWRETIESKVILVFQFGGVSRSEARGFSIADLPLPVVAINRTEWPQARIFSLIHEFIHLTLHQGGLCDFVERQSSRFAEQRLEIFCNRVAGAVLVPMPDLLSDTNLAGHHRGGELAEPKIRDLAKRFRVSREVILRRLLISDQITQDFYELKRDEYEKDFEAEKSSAAPGFAPPHILALSSAGSFFTDLVLRGYRQHRITSADVADYLDMRVKHIGSVEASLNRRTLL